MIVDDDQWIRRMLSTLLEARGYDVLVAENGVDAFEKAGEGKPDLLITDIMMPKMAGWELVKKLRAEPSFALMPVIFLTALNSAEDRLRGFKLGADDYLPKPFHFEEVEIRIKKCLEHRRELESHLHPKETENSMERALQGSLGDFGLPTLLSIFELERKTGILNIVSTNRKRHARVFFRDGIVIRANIVGQGEPRNAAVIYETCRWISGVFEFERVPVEGASEFGDLSVTHLLLEAARLQDESDRS